MRWTLILLLLLPAVTAQSHTVQVSIDGLPAEADVNGTAVLPFQVILQTAGGLCLMPATVTAPLTVAIEAPDNVTVSARVVPGSISFTVPGQTLTGAYRVEETATLVVDAPAGTNVTVVVTATPGSDGCPGAADPTLQPGSATTHLSWAPAGTGADLAPQQTVPAVGLVALLAALTVAARLGARLK